MIEVVDFFLFLFLGLLRILEENAFLEIVVEKETTIILNVVVTIKNERVLAMVIIWNILV